MFFVNELAREASLWCKEDNCFKLQKKKIYACMHDSIFGQYDNWFLLEAFKAATHNGSIGHKSESNDLSHTHERGVDANEPYTYQCGDN